MRKITYIIIIVLFLTSCENEKNINFNLSNYNSKIIINSVNNSDSLVKIFLSKTVELTTDSISFENIKDAQIELYNSQISNSLNDFTLSDTAFNYGYFYNPVVKSSIYDDTVFLKIISDEYGTVLSKSEIPKKLNLTDLFCEYIFDSTENYQTSYFVEGNVKFTISDDEPYKMNYYAVKCFYYNKDNNLKDVILSNSVPEMFDTYMYNEGFIFTDNLFSNNEFNATFDFSIWFGRYENITNNFYIEVKKITEDYYQYQKTYKEHLEAGQSIFTEYLDTYTNVENGYGIFTIYNAVIDSFEIR